MELGVNWGTETGPVYEPVDSSPDQYRIIHSHKLITSAHKDLIGIDDLRIHVPHLLPGKTSFCREVEQCITGCNDYL